MAMVIMDGEAVTVTNTLAGGGSSTEVLKRCQLKLVGILWAPAAACMGWWESWLLWRNRVLGSL
jgi:hypothetical protein